MSRGRAFAADTLGAVHDEWFFRRDRELEGKVAIRCPEGLCAGSCRWGLGAPLIDPDVKTIMRRTGLAQTGPADFFRVVKTPFAEIAYGEMGQVQLADRPL